MLFSLYIWYSDRVAKGYQRELEFYREILDNVPTDIAVFDPDHRYLYLNAAAISSPELRKFILGKNDFEYLKHRGYDVSTAVIRSEKFKEAVDHKATTSWVDRIYSHKNGLQYVKRTFVPSYTDDGRLWRVYGYGANVTELVNLQTKDKDLQNNLQYAKKIQEFLLPTVDQLITSFGKAFVIWNPKDIISGDFYWYRKIDNEHYFAVADCTGTGMSGALLSVICMNTLNWCVDKEKLSSTSEILNHSHRLLTKSGATNWDNGLNDGMDICICKLSEYTLTYSSASVPMFLVRNNEISIYDPENVSIGNNELKDHSFQETTIELLHKDKIYIATDGVIDRFGGNHDRKNGMERVKHAIKQTSYQPFYDQPKLFGQLLGGSLNSNQQDDKTILGIEFQLPELEQISINDQVEAI